MLMRMTPGISVGSGSGGIGGGFIAEMSPTFATGGGFVAVPIPPFALGGSAVERMEVPFYDGGAAVEFTLVATEIGGAFVADLVPGAALPAPASAFSLNAKLLAAAEYDNYPFTSLFRLGTDVYGIAAGGLYKLTGANDNGAQITAEIISGVSTCGFPQLKNAPDVYLDLRGDGDIAITPVYDEDDDPYEFIEPCDNDMHLTTQRVQLDRGAEGTHIQWRLRNMDGSNFDLQSVMVSVQPRRRIIK